MRPGLLRVEGHAVWILLKKTKIPYDSTRWARKPLRPVSAYTLEPLFLHILKAAVSPVIAKPVQGSQLKFSYARNVSCYKLVIHHSRGDGTARPHRLLQVRARYGALANIVPEALSVAFEALTAGTDWEGAVLQAEEIPLSLKCSRCGQIFSPARQKRFSAPCPFCGEEQGHSIGAGRELYIQSMEAG